MEKEAKKQWSAEERCKRKSFKKRCWGEPRPVAKTISPAGQIKIPIIRESFGKETQKDRKVQCEKEEKEDLKIWERARIKSECQQVHK